MGIQGTKCVDLKNITNGYVNMRPNNQFGSVAEYKCIEGFRLRGYLARVCQGDENWSGSEPECYQDYTGSCVYKEFQGIYKQYYLIQ